MLTYTQADYAAFPTSTWVASLWRSIFKLCVRLAPLFMPGSCDSADQTRTTQIDHQYKVMKTAEIDDLSYLTYFPLPLSISW